LGLNGNIFNGNISILFLKTTEPLLKRLISAVCSNEKNKVEWFLRSLPEEQANSKKKKKKRPLYFCFLVLHRISKSVVKHVEHLKCHTD
jgi:hypothetical protein